jgi:peptidoglycan biosynthesis protein MviN/MurJ (putative lipid II flippase)
MRIAIICLFVNLILNLFFIQFFGYLGLVIASAIASYVNLTLLVKKLLQKNYFSFESYFFKNFLIILIISSIMLLFLIFLKEFWQNYDLWQLWKLTFTISSSAILYFTLYYFFYRKIL